jgi:hypothetical protein
MSARVSNRIGAAPLVKPLAAAGGWCEMRTLVRDALLPDLVAPKTVAVKVDYPALEPPPPRAGARHVFLRSARRSDRPARRRRFAAEVAIARALRFDRHVRPGRRWDVARSICVQCVDDTWERQKEAPC